MAHVITFTTARFDVSQERPNPTNPIGGQSVLTWLRGELESAGYACGEPDTEDWGWYMDVTGGEATYLVGASADAAEPQPIVEWIVQIHRHRSVTDKLTGRNKMALDDGLTALVERVLRSDAAIEAVSVDRRP